VNVGDNVGLDTGEFVGAEVEGLEVGALVGVNVGDNVGLETGEFVGPSVGVFDGTAEGLAEGAFVGASEGACEGGAVGTVPVGEGVGTSADDTNWQVNVPKLPRTTWNTPSKLSPPSWPHNVHPFVAEAAMLLAELVVSL
jgi:hypothetical protein